MDVQPNGYRFITGGGDSILAVWNLLPVIAEKFEMQGQPVRTGPDNKSRVSGEPPKEDEVVDTEMVVPA